MGLDRLIKLLPVVVVLVAGCTLVQEDTRYDYTVVNYSPNTYIVQVTYGDGIVSPVAVAPESRTVHSRPSPPVQGVIYEQDCSHKIGTVKPVAVGYWILINRSGNVSTPATMSDFDVTAVPYQGLPIPSSCP